MAFTHALSTNNYGPAKFIVDASAANGTHTTIATAILDAVSGETVFIRPGTYTENLTLKAGVNLTAYTCDASTDGTGHVIIIGKCTMTTAGSVTISGIQLQTNSDYFLEVTGSAASFVSLNDCYLNCANNSGIHLTSSGGAQIQITFCRGNLATTGIAYFVSTNGQLNFKWCALNNSGSSSTQSTVATSGSVDIAYCVFNNAISYSSGTNTLYYTTMSLGGLAVIPITTATGGTTLIRNSRIESSTQSAITVGASTTVNASFLSVDSSNTNAITGAGTLIFDNVTFTSTSNLINTTTQTANYVNLGKYKATGQTAFLAYLPSSDLNQTGNGATYTMGAVTALTKVFDQGTDLNTNGTFTAPVTARYTLGGCFSFFDIVAAAATDAQFNLVTSNRTYRFGRLNPTTVGTTVGSISMLGTVLADMDTADTATLTLQISGAAGNTIDIAGSATMQTFFSGSLQC